VLQVQAEAKINVTIKSRGTLHCFTSKSGSNAVKLENIVLDVFSRVPN